MKLDSLVKCIYLPHIRVVSQAPILIVKLGNTLWVLPQLDYILFRDGESPHVLEIFPECICFGIRKLSGEAWVIPRE